jgi:microcystin-dependent protein
MATPFLAEIRIFAGNFAPFGWAFCNGQVLPISQNTALFSLLGTTYGGNGTSNFALPNLQNSAPMHAGQGTGLSTRDLGDSAGEASVTLGVAQLPSHNHSVGAFDAAGDQTSPLGTVFAEARRGRAFIPAYATVPPSPPDTMSPEAVENAGGGGAHNNLQPYLGLSFIIALQGVFPARN